MISLCIFLDNFFLLIMHPNGLEYVYIWRGHNTSWMEKYDNGSQFFYQLDLLCEAELNNAMEDNNDKNVGGEDTDMQTQPSYPDFSIYFMTDKVYSLEFLFVCVLSYNVMFKSSKLCTFEGIISCLKS